jgi:hypothetical protein
MTERLVANLCCRVIGNCSYILRNKATKSFIFNVCVALLSKTKPKCSGEKGSQNRSSRSQLNSKTSLAKIPAKKGERSTSAGRERDRFETCRSQ